jgi:hypothetical protein
MNQSFKSPVVEKPTGGQKAVARGVTEANESQRYLEMEAKAAASVKRIWPVHAADDHALSTRRADGRARAVTLAAAKPVLAPEAKRKFLTGKTLMCDGVAISSRIQRKVL